MDNQSLQTPNLISPSKTIKDADTYNESNRSGTLIYILIGIIICLVLIIGTLVLSPKSPTIFSSNDNPTLEIKNNKKEVSVTDDLDKKEVNVNKTLNEKIEIDWMLKKIDAEQNKMLIWSKEDYDMALVMEAEAIQLKDKKNYKKSKETYLNAIKKIEGTLLNKDNIFEQHLKNAVHFLNEDELDKAKIYFEKSAAINEEHKIIIRGLQRIDNRGKVIQLYDNAIIEEEKNNLINSIEYINKALIIEPEYIKLKNKLNQITLKKKKIDYKNAISQVLKGIELGQINKAKNQLSIAKKINSNDPIIIELETQINDKNKIIKINKLQKTASKDEKKEHWISAKKLYDSILKIDSNTSFAIVGKERAEYYSYINQLLDVFISKPQRLQNNQIFEKSKKSLNYVKSEINQKTSIQKNRVPKLRKKITLAENIIKDYSTLIDIKIHSDNETNIVIYQVAKYGKLKEKSIQLRPGKYTIVGSKEGYRDYREIINVTANDNKKSINVMCKEKI